jgi:hypothetical protein
MVGIVTVRKLQGQELSLADGQQILLGKPPAWATSLTMQVAAAYGRTDLPTLVWRRWRTNIPPSSSGVCQSPSLLRRSVITVRAGRSEEDQKHVLLHELAHWLVGTAAKHSAVFYVQAMKQFTEYGDLDRSLARELRYKPKECRDGLRLMSPDPAVVEGLLRRANEIREKSIKRAKYHVVVNRAGEVEQVVCYAPLTDDERQEAAAFIERRWPLTSVPPKWSVRAPIGKVG